MNVTGVRDAKTDRPLSEGSTGRLAPGTRYNSSIVGIDRQVQGGKGVAG